ncbi:MAG TPA: YIP1 family protein [Verrucomicrobiae bacterium]|jgi:hypothetical protein
MDATPTAPVPEPSSLTDRLVNVITAPGEAFEEIKNTPVSVSNWLVPLVLVFVCTVIYVCVAFSQPDVLRTMDEQRAKQFQKSVAAGKITQAQADQAAAATQNFLTPTVLKMFSAGFAGLGCAALLFLMALALWLALKWFTEAGIGYMKVVEAAGLALVILVPQIIVRILLVVWKQNMLSTLSPTLFLANPNASNKTDVLLSMFDVIDIWWLAILSLGLSKVANLRYPTAAVIVFVIWFGFRLIALALMPSG